LYLENEKHKRLLHFELDLPGTPNTGTGYLGSQESDRTMVANEEFPVKDVESSREHVEKKPHYANVNEDDVGYREYLESLDVEFLPKEERWVRWKLDVRINAL
jgi:hypothetical protein